MRNTEVYDKFFVDEEYELQNAPADTYSYRSGWNNALKRASIIVSNEIRPKGNWEEPYESNGRKFHKCSHCHISSRVILFDNFCPNCGADMRGSQE